MADDTLLSHEIECHQFREPLPLSARPPSRLRRLAARAAGRVWFRVGWTCPHLKAVLESAETEMLLRGELRDHLDIYQLQGGAPASGGTHFKPGAADLGQTSDAQITTLRRNGGDFQRRTPDQGFILHSHGFAQGCSCGSPALLRQKSLWNRRLNGLVSNGRIQGLWPTKKWSTALAERAKVIVGLKEDIVRDAVAQAVRQVNGRIPVWTTVRQVTVKPQPVPADLKGWTVLRINDKGDQSAAIGESKGVDVGGAIELKTGAQPALVRLWWALVDVKDDETVVRYIHYRSQSAWVPANTGPFGVEKSFDEPIPKAPAAGRKWRLRLLVRSSQPVTITAVEVTGKERVA